MLGDWAMKFSDAVTLVFLAAIAAAVVRAAEPVPVTAKIRIGWDAQSVNATENARHLEQAGISRLTVHGRTRAQGYSGEADWNVGVSVEKAAGLMGYEAKVGLREGMRTAVEWCRAQGLLHP